MRGKDLRVQPAVQPGTRRLRLGTRITRIGTGEDGRLQDGEMTPPDHRDLLDQTAVLLLTQRRTGALKALAPKEQTKVQKRARRVVDQRVEYLRRLRR